MIGKIEIGETVLHCSVAVVAVQVKDVPFLKMMITIYIFIYIIYNIYKYINSKIQF